MGLAMRLKKQYINQYKNIYVTIPDLHFRKSLMHAIFVRYEIFGLQHIAKLIGYSHESQWSYLKNTCSIHKSFEFVELLAESMRIALSYEFINDTVANGLLSRNNVGYDEVIEDVNLLAGQFRHKRQTVDQAITQSNCIDILTHQKRNLDNNLDSIGNPSGDEIQKTFLDKYPTWVIEHNSLLLQRDTYQCGTWCCFFIDKIFECLSCGEIQVSKMVESMYTG